MENSFRAVMKSLAPFDDTELSEIMKSFTPEHAVKGETLLEQGSTCGKFYFVASGCIRVFFLTPDGTEKTRYIMPDNHMGTALASFITQKPSFEQIDALDDTRLLSISHSQFCGLATSMEHWRLFYQKILEMAYAFQTHRIESLVTMTAKERYEQAMAEQPLLFRKVSNSVMASYLDMAPETLSRLKSK